MTIETLQAQSQVKTLVALSKAHDYRDAEHWDSRDYSYELAAQREEQSQKAYWERLKACHAIAEEKEGTTGVDAFNRIVDTEALDPEVLAILKSDPDAMSNAEREGFEFTGFDLLDSEIATPDLGIGSYAVKGEAAWSGKSEDQTPDVIDYYTEDDVLIKVYSPESVDTSGRFVPKAYERKQRTVTKARAFHDIEFVLDTRGRVRAKLETTKGNAQSYEDRLKETQDAIEAARAKKLERLAKRFGK